MSSLRSSFLGLPDDVRLEICMHISVVDLLSLKKTCRVLYVFGSSDYLWHQIISRLDLPLDISPDVEVNTVSAAELQQMAVKAIKFDHNWRKPMSKIKRLITAPKVEDGRYFDEIQLLPGARWAMTAERRRFLEQSSTHMSLWSLQNVTDVYRASSFDINGRFKYFAIAPQKGTDSAIVAITLTSAGEELLQVYTVALGDPLDSEHAVRTTPKLNGSISRPGTFGIIHEVDVHGAVVAATSVDFLDNVEGHVYQILFFNVHTGMRTLVKPRLPEATRRLTVRLYDQYLALIGVSRGVVFIHIYELPQSMITTKKHPSFPFVTDIVMEGDQNEEFGPLIREYRTSHLSGPHDFFVSDGTHHRDTRTASVSLLAFRSFYDDSPADSYIFHVRLDLTPTEVLGDLSWVYPHKFRTRGATSVDRVHVGRYGRGVWLEHQWEIEEVRLMKLSASETGGYISEVLLPSYPGLPFTPRSCQALAFDEINGRLCLGLHTGELYILDF